MTRTAIITILFFLITTITANSQSASYKYRIWLSDKDLSEYSISQPEKFLSQSCIERRTRQGIAIDQRDLPVCSSYIKQIEKLGCQAVVTSRWLNTAVVSLQDTALLTQITALPFVNRAECVWKNNISQTANKQLRERQLTASPHTETSDYSVYGNAWLQINQLNLDSLHDAGYRGKGMTIAVLDAGFYGVEGSSRFNLEKIKLLHDFAHGTMVHKDETHGTEVLSCMSIDREGEYIGSAPDAEYILIVTEDIDSEYPIEEDYWVAGAEMADSIGADIINSSLAYNRYDDEKMSYTHDNLDGKTAFCSQAAQIASQKGLLVVVAAGNDYQNSWQKIAVPADAPGILTVGSVTATGDHSSFSSCGYTADGRVKPDVMALGSNAITVTAGDASKINSGTSFAAPTMCGAAACLWQSHPEWSVGQLIANIQSVGSHYTTPDELFGYGIPDIYAAYRRNSGINRTTPAEYSLYVERGKIILPNTTSNSTLAIYDISGRLVSLYNLQPECKEIETGNMATGVYIVVWQNAQERKTLKINL